MATPYRSRRTPADTLRGFWPRRPVSRYSVPRGVVKLWVDRSCRKRSKSPKRRARQPLLARCRYGPPQPYSGLSAAIQAQEHREGRITMSGSPHSRREFVKHSPGHALERRQGFSAEPSRTRAVAERLTSDLLNLRAPSKRLQFGGVFVPYAKESLDQRTCSCGNRSPTRAVAALAYGAPGDVASTAGAFHADTRSDNSSR